MFIRNHLSSGNFNTQYLMYCFDIADETTCNPDRNELILMVIGA